MVWYFCSGRHVFLLLTFFARNSLEAMNKILKPEYESSVCNAGNGRTCPTIQLRCIFVFRITNFGWGVFSYFCFLPVFLRNHKTTPEKKYPLNTHEKKKIETTKHSQKKVAKPSLSLPNTKTIIQKQTKTIIE